MPVSPEDLERAARLLVAGKLVAFPTETVYGLGANGLDPVAVARIFEAKGRPSTSPLILHVDSVAMARDLAAAWPPAAEKLTREFWPGPLTLVLPKKEHVPHRVTAGLDTVGIRMPDHPVALALIRACGVPLAAPSANRFTQLSPTRAEHVRAGLGEAVDLILDAGPTRVGIESAVLSLASDPPVLLRPGIISLEHLRQSIGAIELAGRMEGPHASPGLHPRHYSPRTPLIIGKPPADANAAYIWWREEAPARSSIQMPGTPDAYATELYRVLHEADTGNFDLIAVEPVPENAEWAGVADRLRRASNR